MLIWLLTAWLSALFQCLAPYLSRTIHPHLRNEQNTKKETNQRGLHGQKLEPPKELRNPVGFLLLARGLFLFGTEEEEVTARYYDLEVQIVV